jgi:hypothetical protein
LFCDTPEFIVQIYKIETVPGLQWKSSAPYPDLMAFYFLLSYWVGADLILKAAAPRVLKAHLLRASVCCLMGRL